MLLFGRQTIAYCLDGSVIKDHKKEENAISKINLNINFKATQMILLAIKDNCSLNLCHCEPIKSLAFTNWLHSRDIHLTQ